MKGISEAQKQMPPFSLIPGNHQGGCYLIPGLAQRDRGHSRAGPQCCQGERGNVRVLGRYGQGQRQDDR